jgi:hypothetical protein
MNIFEVTLKEATLGGFPVKVLTIQDQGVEEGIRDPNEIGGPDSMRQKFGSIIKQAVQNDEAAYNASAFYQKLWNIYGGDIDAIIDERSIFELKKLAKELVAIKNQGVEEASPMIKPPTNRFDSKQEAFAHVKQHGGRVFKSTYTDPNTGMKSTTFVVKKDQDVDEATLSTMRDYYAGNKYAMDKTKLSQMRDYFSKIDSDTLNRKFKNPQTVDANARRKIIKKDMAETSISSQVSLPKWQMGLPVFVKHLGQKGEIASLSNDFAIVNVDMRQYRVPLSGLKRYPNKGVTEAIKLNAPQRTIPRDELQGYADRIKTGTKTKRDKFAPIIHGSNIRAITKDDENTEWDLDDLARQITTRPKAILGTNAKMEKSKTEGEIIYDLTLPALSGIVVDEDTGDFVEITTCPGAGQCQLFCYARKGGYVMFPASSMSAAQALNFLVNDPEGYSARVNQEIKTVKAKADKAGIQLVVRWHDAGDFFSKEYLDLAYDVAKSNPDVQFYAYTKMGDVATGATPKNFTMNFSSGSKRGEEKKVEIYKQQNPGATVKQGVTVPKDMFFDLIARKGNSLIKDAKGRTQFASSEALDTFKQRIAQKYKVAPDSIITYDQMLATPVGTEPKWNVIVQPGAGDRAANRKDVIDSYLMFH